MHVSYRENADSKTCIVCDAYVEDYVEEICAISENNIDCTGCEFVGNTEVCEKQDEPASVPLCLEHRT